MRAGLSYREALDIPLGELKDLMAIEQIKREGAKLKVRDVDAFLELGKIS